MKNYIVKTKGQTMNPKVSIIIPVYNGSNYLKEAIDSAIAQTYKNIEVLVINDGSNDNGATEKIAKSYGDKIKYIKKKNGGVATALNLGIKEMTGEYFSWLSHDDLYKKNKIKRQIRYLSKLEDKNVVLYSDYELIDTNGKLLERQIKDHEMLEKKPIYSLLRGAVNGITMLIPKKVFRTHGNFDTSLRCTQDYDMWNRIRRDYKFIHISQVLSVTRIHKNQDTISNPKAISEGNSLWIRIISDLSKKEKIDTEGSLFKFYLEMVKFIKYTPYDKAAEFCKKKLKNSILNESNIDACNDINEIKIIFKSLIEEKQLVTAALYLNRALNQMRDSQDVDTIVDITQELLVGDVKYIKKNEIKLMLSNTSTVKRERIMFCSGHWLTGGMERVMSILFPQLRDYYDIFLITPFDGRSGSIELPEYVKHIKISNQNFYDNFDYIASTFALQFKIDIVIGFMNLFDKQLDLYAMCNELGIKTIASNHEIYFYPYKSQHHYDLVRRRLNVFAGVNAVLWLTNFSNSVYGLEHDNGYLIHNPNTYAVSDTQDHTKSKNILCVGRFNDYIKRVDRMLECFSIVSKDHPDASLILVGKYDREIPIKPNSNTSINDMIAALGIDDSKVVFTGEVCDVDKYYKQASLLLLTSNNEGFGMVINEAACFGVPSVCNKIPGLEDLIIDGKNGYLVDQGDIVSMASRVSEILSDNKLRDELGNNARDYVKKFSADTIGSQWRGIIKSIACGDTPKEIRKKVNAVSEPEKVDYKKLCNTLFNELNDVFYEINLNYSSQIEDDRIDSRLIDYHKKLTRTLRTHGTFGTSKMIIKKIYKRIRR